MQSVTVTVRRVYGCPVIYPANETARTFARIAGTKTLTLEALQHIKTLGFPIVEAHESQLPAALK